MFSEMPLASFARLGKHFLSKTQMLNKLLSNTEQYMTYFTILLWSVEMCHKEFQRGLSNSAGTFLVATVL